MVCVHLFDCTCLDDVIRGVVCHHVHAVSMANPTQVKGGGDWNQCRGDAWRFGQFDSTSKEYKNCTELEDLRRNALSVIAELTDVIQIAPNSDTVHAALRHVCLAISMARGLAVIGTGHQYLKTKSYPANKLVEKQKQFFSTKTKRNIKGKSSVLSESTVQELNNIDPYVCTFCFKEDPPSVMDWVLLTG